MSGADDPLGSFDAFVAHLTGHGTLQALAGDGTGRAEPDADLVDDLGLDSLALLEVVLVLDDLGVTLDESDLGRCRTLRALYRRAVGSAGAGVGSW